MEFTAKQLAGVLKGTVDGNPEAKATSFAKIEHGKPGQLCFFANPKYEEYVYTCKASILLVNKDFVPKQEVTPTMVRVENAYTAIAELLKYVATQKRTDRRHRGFRSSWFLTSKFERKYISEAIPMSATTPSSVTTRRSSRTSISVTIPSSASTASFIRE